MLEVRFVKLAALLATVGFLVSFAKSAHADPSCSEWMTEEFYSAANSQDVRACLEAGANIVGRDDVGRTPLHLAATAAVDSAVVAELLLEGADIELTDAKGRRPIHVAAAMGRTPGILSYLIAWGSDPDTQLPGTRCSWRSIARCATAPLHLAAARSDSAEYVVALLAAGAEPDERDEKGRSALHHAAANAPDRLSAAALLQAGASEDISDLEGFTPLHLAAQRIDGAPEIIDALLSAGASADAGDRGGTTPVIWAARTAPHSRIVVTLIDASEDPCVADKQERTALTQWDLNDNLERVDEYWALHERCSE